MKKARAVCDTAVSIDMRSDKTFFFARKRFTQQNSQRINKIDLRNLQV